MEMSGEALSTAKTYYEDDSVEITREVPLSIAGFLPNGLLAILHIAQSIGQREDFDHAAFLSHSSRLIVSFYYGVSKK